MDRKKKTTLILDVILLALSAFFAVGVKLIFPACGIHDDGGYGSCHWAEQAVFVMALAACLLSLILVLARDRAAQMAVSAGLAGCSILAALVPNIFIPLCMMPTMRCQSTMRPFVLACGIILAVLALWNLFLNRPAKKSVQS